jgi:hypothetical protein
MKIEVKRLIGLKLIICVFAFALCMACSAQTSGKTIGNGSARGEFFFGTSQDAKHCPSAWLLNIDKEHHVGGIFVATEMTQFSRFEVGDDGTVFFQWKGFGDKNYQFKGTLKADELAGEIELVDKRSGNSKYLCDMAASQLPSQNVQARRSARYSNAYYFNESGDLTGVDIRFFSTNKGTTGMIVFYEDYWDEPTFTPLALSQVEVGKGTIQFAAETPKGIIHYHLRLTPAGGLFNRDDKAKEGEKDIPLKTGRLLPVVGW